MKICYFVHDLAHPDLARRVSILRQGGADVAVLGFRRGPEPDIAEAETIIDLGMTRDGQLVRRILIVSRTIPRLRQWGDLFASSDVIIARNLEMLFLATLARRRHAPHASLVYECLDIHGIMLARGLKGYALRKLEQFLLRQSQGLIVSSPGFIREYFEGKETTLPKSFLIENKVNSIESHSQPRKAKAKPAPPWRIGWFGIIRCRRSLEILTHLVRSAPGLVEVIIAGTPTSVVFDDDETSFLGISGLTFLGPYQGEAEAAHLFASVHFAWTIDFYEAGRNSDWLLPNRLYRAALYGAVPIAMAHVETGQWLKAHGAGILLEEPAEDTLLNMLRRMSTQEFAEAKAALENIPRVALVTEPEECRELVQRLVGLGEGRQVAHQR